MSKKPGEPAPAGNPPAEGDGAWAPPATQADFDKIIEQHLAGERAKFADYDQLKESAARLAQIEEDAKTEGQRQAENRARLEAEVSQLKHEKQVRQWRDQVARETGIPASALAGNSLAEVQAHAEQLAPLIAAANPAPAEGSPKPVPALGTHPGSPLNMSLPDKIAAAEKAGDAGTVATLKALMLGKPSS